MIDQILAARINWAPIKRLRPDWLRSLILHRKSITLCCAHCIAINLFDTARERKQRHKPRNGIICHVGGGWRAKCELIGLWQGLIVLLLLTTAQLERLNSIPIAGSHCSYFGSHYANAPRGLWAPRLTMRATHYYPGRRSGPIGAPEWAPNNRTLSQSIISITK